jgi:[ribosomal protein S5]-alanine N-acetyltransferase
MNNETKLRIIETANLQLVGCELAHAEAILRDKQELGQMLGVKVFDEWPEFPETIQHVYEHLKSDPTAPEWGYRMFVHKEDRALIGEGGFKGQPSAEGMVEIGYAIVPAYRRRGLALEAARGLSDYAFSHAEVKIIQAHTLKDGTPSINILKKLGMKLVGEVNDPEDGYVLQWRMEKKDYLS